MIVCGHFSSKQFLQSLIQRHLNYRYLYPTILEDTIYFDSKAWELLSVNWMAIGLNLTQTHSERSFLWVLLIRSHIDYAERMWERFTQLSTSFTRRQEELDSKLRGPLPLWYSGKLTWEISTIPEVDRIKGKEKVGREDSLPYAELDLSLAVKVTTIARPNPDDVAESQPLPTPSVLAGPNLEHSEVEIIDPSSDSRRSCPLYQGPLSSLQHLAKDFSFGDQFLNDKPSEADNEKTTVDTEAESMILHCSGAFAIHTTTTVATTTTLPLHLNTHGPSCPILIEHMGDLEVFIVNLVEGNQALETHLDKQGSLDQ
ncbi:hypothetical protein Tco_1353817 [Tanacetum coccineum]